MGFLNTTSNDSTSATMEYGNQLIQVLSKRLKLRLNGTGTSTYLST